MSKRIEIRNVSLKFHVIYSIIWYRGYFEMSLCYTYCWLSHLLSWSNIYMNWLIQIVYLHYNGRYTPLIMFFVWYILEQSDWDQLSFLYIYNLPNPRAYVTGYTVRVMSCSSVLCQKSDVDPIDVGLTLKKKPRDFAGFRRAILTLISKNVFKTIGGNIIYSRNILTSKSSRVPFGYLAPFGRLGKERNVQLLWNIAACVLTNRTMILNKIVQKAIIKKLHNSFSIQKVRLTRQK